jgi:hypothetical protein
MANPIAARLVLTGTHKVPRVAVMVAVVARVIFRSKLKTYDIFKLELAKL